MANSFNIMMMQSVGFLLVWLAIELRDRIGERLKYDTAKRQQKLFEIKTKRGLAKANIHYLNFQEGLIKLADQEAERNRGR